MEKNKMITLTNYEIETFVNSLSMNDNDKANLTFLLSIDKDSLNVWFNTIEDEDKIYASNLLDAALSEYRKENLDNYSYIESMKVINKVKSKHI
jgi:hypothetical protein